MGNLERAKNITTMEKLVQGTVQNANGTSIDFTGIPSWAKKITVMFNGVSTNGTSNHLVRLGDSGGVETSGYISNLTGVTYGGSGIGGGDLTSFLWGVGGSASNIFTGSMVIYNISGTTWICSTVLAGLNSTFTASGAGSKTLTGTLDRIRITTANGTDTFDAGQINIMYEG